MFSELNEECEGIVTKPLKVCRLNDGAPLANGFGNDRKMIERIVIFDKYGHVVGFVRRLG